MRKYIYFIALICCALSASTSYAQKKVIKTMMIAGQDGSHYWRGACEAMKQILENSGMFKVDFVFTPDFGGDINTFKPDFAKYNLVVVNYGGEVWPEPVQKAFENYVADGGGVVIIHSSVVPMAGWKAYNEIIGMGAWEGRNEKDGPYLYWKEGKYVYDYTPGYAGYHGLPRASCAGAPYFERSAYKMETFQGRDLYPLAWSGTECGDIGYRL